MSRQAVRRGLSAGRRERGVVSIEFLAMLPLLLAIALLALQVGAIGYTAISAQEAARAAARASARGMDVTGTASGLLPPGARLVSVSRFGAPDHGVRLTVEAPRVSSMLPPFRVTRQAVMP